MQPETPTSKPRRGRHFGRWILLGILATFGWSGWKAYDFHLAKQEAEALGWRFEISGPVEKIRLDWRAAFRIQTWSDTQSSLWTNDSSQFESHLVLLQRLNPTIVRSSGKYPLKDLSPFQSLPRLSILELNDCAELINLDSLKGIKGLKEFTIDHAPFLNNLDGLKDLEHLFHLRLNGCKRLPNVNALRNLKSLKSLSLSMCSRLQNIDGLLGLTQLRVVQLSGCAALSKDAVDAARAALPKTGFVTPDNEFINPDGESIFPGRK